MDRKLLPPSIEASKAFREGEGLSANPYKEGSDEYEVFNWEMHQLQVRELKDLNQQLRAGL